MPVPSTRTATLLLLSAAYLVDRVVERFRKIIGQAFEVPL